VTASRPAVGQLKAIYPDEAKNVTVRVELVFVNG
jgi:hypothetical protein